MGQGQKGSSDKKQSQKNRDVSPAQEDSKRCRVCRFPLLVALLQLLLGVAVTAVAFLMLAISHSLTARETPHWAGIILLYFVLCTTGLVISVLVVAFAGHHHSQASSFICRQAEEDCECVLDLSDPIARTFNYKEVSDCEAITSTLTFYYLLQILLNLAQAVVCAIGAFIMWKHRYQVFFAGIQISSPSTHQWQNV
ncbi:sarcospan isoform X2 [Girardinichthys multiradiatus]|uniref:sarcospan isoform X2 n=1 Tax=Girardinichthys multiradiatus TaxID=208333 RepID=UPI001FAD8C53|nr:sarcospan isoform X2 [Girardinichthys multiradiatus]